MFRRTKLIASHVKNRSSRMGTFQKLLNSQTVNRAIYSQHRTVTTKSDENISSEALKLREIRDEELKIARIEAKQQAELLAKQKIDKIDQMRNRQYYITNMETSNIVSVLKVLFSTKEEMHKTVMNKNSAEFMTDAMKRMQATNYLDQVIGKFVNGYRLRLSEAFKMDEIVSKRTKQNVDTPKSNQYAIQALSNHDYNTFFLECVHYGMLQTNRLTGRVNPDVVQRLKTEYLGLELPHSKALSEYEKLINNAYKVQLEGIDRLMKLTTGDNPFPLEFFDEFCWLLANHIHIMTPDQRLMFLTKHMLFFNEDSRVFGGKHFTEHLCLSMSRENPVNLISTLLNYSRYSNDKVLDKSTLTMFSYLAEFTSTPEFRPQTLICPDYIGQHILSSTRQHFQKASKKLSK